MRRASEAGGAGGANQTEQDAWAGVSYTKFGSPARGPASEEGRFPISRGEEAGHEGGGGRAAAAAAAWQTSIGGQPQAKSVRTGTGAPAGRASGGSAVGDGDGGGGQGGHDGQKSCDDVSQSLFT